MHLWLDRFIGDSFDLRATKRDGATAGEAAFKISAVHRPGGYLDAGASGKSGRRD
jgi:hypothetical protein